MSEASNNAGSPKVLKIGLVVDEQLVQERVIDHGAVVTISAAEGATFRAEGTELPDGAAVFVYRDGRYYLRAQGSMKGRVTSTGNKVAVEKALKKGEGEADGDARLFPLDADDKGKLTLGTVTVLFRFVEPPPPPAPVAVEVVSYRAKLIEDDDPVFLGWLGVTTALALVFSVWVSNAERVEIAFEDLPKRFTTIKLPPPEVKAEVDLPPPTENAEGTGKVEEKPADAPPKEAADGGDKVKSAKAVNDAKKNIQQSSALFQAVQAQMFGTMGANSRGSVLLDNADGAFNDLSGKLEQVADQAAFVGDGSRIRGGAGVVGGTGDKTIGDIEKGIDGGAGGKTDLGKAPEVKVKGSVAASSLDFDGGDATNVKKVIANYKAQLVFCHEQALKLNPKVAGKVTVSWYVEGGAATDVNVIENTTDDKDLGACVVGKIRRWKFGEVPDGTVQNTFVFQPKSD